MACNLEIFFIAATWFSLCVGKPVTAAPHSTMVLLKNGINPKYITGPGFSSARITYLYSSNSGMYIRIHKDKVDGKGQRLDKDAKLLMESAGFGGQVRIMSYIGNRYLCLAGNGDVVVEQPQQGRLLDRCIFIQSQFKGHTVFQSKINASWYLGVKGTMKVHKGKAGEMKSATKTSKLKRAARFQEY